MFLFFTVFVLVLSKDHYSNWSDEVVNKHRNTNQMHLFVRRVLIIRSIFYFLPTAHADYKIQTLGLRVNISAQSPPRPVYFSLSLSPSLSLSFPLSLFPPLSLFLSLPLLSLPLSPSSSLSLSFFLSFFLSLSLSLFFSLPLPSSYLFNFFLYNFLNRKMISIFIQKTKNFLSKF